jgi:hypothetical protein
MANDMDKQQEQFENYLREFEPRRPRALPTAGKAMRVRRAAAGVLAVALCAGALWLAWRRSITTDDGSVAVRTPPSQEVSPRELTRLALEDPRRFEEALAAASKRILPRFDGQDSALRVLAK